MPKIVGMVINTSVGLVSVPFSGRIIEYKKALYNGGVKRVEIEAIIKYLFS